MVLLDREFDRIAYVEVRELPDDVLIVEKQVVVIYMATRKLLLDIPTDQILEFEKGLLEYMDTKYSHILEKIRRTKVLDDEIEENIVKAVGEYKEEVM